MALFATTAGSGAASSSLDTNMDHDFAEMWIKAPFSQSNPLHNGLKEMDEQLRCGICHEFMKVPSALPCKHTFCNCCIQQYGKDSIKSMRRKMNCPTCRADIPGTDITKSLIVINALESFIDSYKVVRPLLQQALRPGTATEAAPETNAEGDDNGLVALNDSHVNSRRRKRSRRNYAENDEDEDDNQETESEEDECVEVVSMKKRRKMSYHGKKKKQLKDMCKEEGLPTDGTEEELRARHEAFITLYNTECDSIHPRSPAKIVKEIVSEERKRKAEARNSRKDSKIMDQLKKNREQLGNSPSGEGGMAYSGNAEFDSKMKSNFAKMAAELKARKAKQSAPKPPTDSSPSSSPQQENMEAPVESPANVDNNDVATQQGANGPTETPSTATKNPDSKQRSSTASATSTNPDSSNNPAASFLSTSNITTPSASAPEIFLNSDSAPSTITKKQSQSFALMSQNSDPTPAVATKVDSPKANGKQPLRTLPNPNSSNVSTGTTSSKATTNSSSSEASENDPNYNSTRVKPKAAEKAKAKPVKKASKSKVARNNTSSAANANRPRAPAAPAAAPTRQSKRKVSGQWNAYTPSSRCRRCKQGKSMAH